MKKSLLILTLSLLFVIPKSFAQTVPTTSWADVANTDWFNLDNNVFTLTTAEEFAGLATLVNDGTTFLNLTINIGADIDLGEHLWTPIGNTAQKFMGTVDGGEHVISNLFINIPSSYYGGLFGACRFASLKNIILSETYVRAGFNSGSLVGNFSEGDIENCHATGVDIVCDDANIGGLVGGLVTNSTMHRCSSQGSVTGINQVGGLLGTPWDLTEISECFSTGTVNAVQQAGGLIGHSTFAFGPNRFNVINNCYSRADVVVNGDLAGGLVGSSDANLFVYNSYSTGTATGDELIGGFIGGVGSATIEDSYWDTETSGHETGLGGWMAAPGELNITGKTTEEMKTSEMVTLLGLNQNDSPWTINPEINDGYPSFTGIVNVSAPAIEISNVEVFVYPNIVDAHIQIEAVANLKSYSIYDLSGKVIAQGSLMGNASQINAQNLASGDYILLIDTDQGSASQKFMKK